MKSNASLIYNSFLVVGDFLALVAAFVGAYILRVSLDARPIAAQVSAHTYLNVFIVLLPFWLIIFALLGLYNTNIHENRFSELGRLFIGTFIGLMFVVFWNYLSPKPIFPAKLVPIYGFILAFILLVLFRSLARVMRNVLFSFGVGLTRVLIIGNTNLSKELVDSLIDSRHSGYRVLGVVGDSSKFTKKYPDLPVFNSFDDALSELKKEQIHSIVQTELYADEEKNRAILEYAQTHHIGYRFTPGNTELFVGNLEVELFRSSVPVITVHQTSLFGWGRIVKRLFDIFIATSLLILLSPLFLIIAACEKLSDGGTVFFRQKRLTRFNHVFKVFKFRTLVTKYNGLSPEDGFAKMGRPELAIEFRENGDFLPNDPRFSKLGRFLRKTSLDELPQLLNVIKGDLSLVGPRALVPQELELYQKRHSILSVKSGITGLAQVSGRKSISFDERRKLDLYYVQNWSFWMDLVILMKTLRVIVTGQGAE